MNMRILTPCGGRVFGNHSLSWGGDRFSKDAAELVDNIKKSVVAGNLSQEVIDETYSAVLDFLRPTPTSSSTASQSCPNHSNTKGRKRKRAFKRYKYAITQINGLTGFPLSLSTI
jgi:hypothetical protein